MASTVSLKDKKGFTIVELRTMPIQFPVLDHFTFRIAQWLAF